MTNNLNHYLKLWDLQEPELLAETPRAQVYSVYRGAEKLALKLFTAEGLEDEYDGVVAFQHFGGNGAVRLLAHADEAQLLEWAGDQELAEMVWGGDDLRAAAIIADVLNKLHHAPANGALPPMRNLRLRFRSLFDKAARDKAAGEHSIYVRGAQAAEYLLATSQDECLLHGDIHHHNIRLHPARGWLAFDPKGLYGERLYDAANTLCNPCNARERVLSEERMLQVSKVLADGMGVDVTRLRTFVFAYACLSASWFGDEYAEDEADVLFQILTVAENAERHADYSV